MSRITLFLAALWTPALLLAARGSEAAIRPAPRTAAASVAAKNVAVRNVAARNVAARNVAMPRAAAAPCAVPAPCCPTPAPCCPPPNIEYRHRRGCCSSCNGCCAPPPVETVLVATPPCGGCPIEVTVCVPGCATGAPRVCYDRGFLGRNVEWFEWPNGFAVKVVFRYSGDLIVTSFGS